MSPPSGEGLWYLPHRSQDLPREIPPPIVVLPHVPGHEVAGEVVAVGEKVSWIKKGDLGILYLYVACHRCDWCLSGQENLCPILKRIGFELPGGYAQYVRAPSYSFCSFSRKLRFEEMAILTDAVAVSYRAVKILADALSWVIFFSLELEVSAFMVSTLRALVELTS